MARSIGYGGGRDYGYPDGGGSYGGSRGPAFQVTPLGASDETLSSITELAQIVRKRREAEEAKAREADAEFRRITIDVPEGFVTRAKQQVGGNTPEHKIAAAVTAQKMWDEEKDRQKHAADVSKQIEESTKEAEKSAQEIRKEATTRRQDLMKLEGERQKAIAAYEKAKQGHGVKAAKARQRDEMAAARLGEAYNPAVHSTFDEDAPEMPTRTVYVYDPDWNIVGSQQLPVTDPRNFIQTNPNGDIFPEGVGQPGGAVPSAPRPSAQGAMPRPPAGAPREPAAGGGGMSLAEITRQGVLAKKALEEEKAAEADRVKWNKAVQTAAAALRQNRALAQRTSAALQADPNYALSATKLPMDDADVITEKWDWSVGEPPSIEEIESGAALRRTKSKAQLKAEQAQNVAGTDEFFGRLRQPEGAAAPPPAAASAAAPPPTPQSPADARYAQFLAGVEQQASRMGSPAEASAYRERMARNWDATNGVPENWLNVRSEARRIAQTQGPEAGQAFLNQMIQKLQPREASMLAKAGAWTLRIGLPLASGAGAGLVSGGTLALPAGAAGGLLGEDLARRLTGEAPMTPGEVGIVGALGMIPGGTGGRMTTQSIKQAALHSAGAGAALGALGSATLPAVGANPQLPTVGGVAAGAATGAVLGGVLGAAISRFMPGASRQAQAAVAGDEQVQALARALETTPAAGRGQVLALLRARIGELNQPGNPDFIGPVRTMEDQMAGATPEMPQGPPAPTVEQRFTSSPAEDLFDSMVSQAAKIPPPHGAAPLGPLGKPTGLRAGQESLVDPTINQQAKAAAQKAELDALVAKHPWMRAGRGEEAALVGEPLQGPLLPGQTSVAQPIGVTPDGIQLPEGVQSPSPRAVERAGAPRTPGSPEDFTLWLHTQDIVPRQWDEMLQNPEAADEVARIIAKYNQERTATPKPPSFRSWLEGKGISKSQWDLLLNAEDPQSVARADQIINEYNDAHGLTAEGPLDMGSAAAGPRPARNVNGPQPDQGLFDLMADRIGAAAEQADIPTQLEQYPAYLRDTGVVRGRVQAAAGEGELALENLIAGVRGARENAAAGRERVAGKNEPATVQAGAEVMRAQQAIAAAEEALAKGGVTTTKRWENVAKRGQGEGGGAQPFEEVPLSVAGNPDPQSVARGTFDVALQTAEEAVAGARAARTATKNNPEVANRLNAAVRELEQKLQTLRAAQQVGRTETRPVAAMRQTAEALKLTRDGLVAAPQDRNLAQRARMLTARLVDLAKVGGRNRYRGMRGPDGKWYVLREATAAGEPFEGKVGALKERALAGPFTDAEQATSFAAELEARWADVVQAREGGWPEGMAEPTLPKGQRGRGTATTETPVSQFPDERALRRAETLSAKQLQDEWATAGRAMPGGRWQFGGSVPQRALGKSKAVESGRMRKPSPTKLGLSAKQLAAEDAAVAALKLSPAQRAALSGGESPPFDAAGGGAQAEFLGIPSAFRFAGKAAKAVAGNRYAKALIMGPRHTLKILSEDFGPAGRKIAQDFLEYQDTYHGLAGNWKNELQQALGLLKTEAQKQDLTAVLEDSALAGAADPEVQLAAATIRTTLDDVANLAKTNNRFAKYLNDYFPRYALEQPDFKQRAAMLAQNLWNSKFHRTRMQALGAASANAPEALSYAGTQMLSPHISGFDAKNVHLEKARSSTHGLAYRTDPEVMFQYLDSAARAIAQAKHFDRPLPGVGGQPSTQRLGSLKNDLSNLELANPTKSDRVRDLRYALERELGFREPGHEPGILGRTAADVRDMVASSRLMASFITQMGSLADTANTFGWKGVGAALKGMGSARAEENAVRAGSASAAAERQAREIAMLLRGGGGSQGGSPISKLIRGHKWIGPDAVWMDAMVKVDRQQRIGADSAARVTMPQLIEDLQRGNGSTIELLRAAGVSEKLLVDVQQLNPAIVKRHIAGQAIPADDLRVIDAYARRMTDFSQQRPSPANLPPSWSTEPGRWMTMFMPFSLRQTQNMVQAIRRNPKRFVAAGAPAYLVMGALVNAAKGFLSGYGMVGTNDSNRTTADKIQQVLSNRPVAPDSPEDLALRIAQALAATAPKPFVITAGEKLERGLESVPDAVMALTGPAGSALLAGPSAVVRGAAGVGQPKGMGRGEYAARGAVAGAAHALLPSTFSYQIQRELMPPEGQFARKMRPPHRPGWVGRGMDVPSEAERIGLAEAAKNFLLGGALGTEQYLSPPRQQRKRNIEEWKRKEKRASAGAR